MPAKSTDFYKDLPSFNDFREVVETRHFRQVPDSWWAVLTDVKGSTEAIKAGRYREVNTLGASGISAALNTTKDLEIPYVFGGDGASFLIPEEKLEGVLNALHGTQKMARDFFQLELRVGAVRADRLRDSGYPILIGKYELAPGVFLAQFRGGGLTKAEELLKKGGDGVRVLEISNDVIEPDLSGLSCRWEPMRSRQGTILTLLATSQNPLADSSQLYSQIIREIEKILGHSLNSASPVSASALKGRWSIRSFLREARLHSWKTLRLGQVLKYALIHGLAALVTRFDMTLGDFDSKKYKQGIERNSDFKKFDDMLRMVIDCPAEKSVAIENFLQSLLQRNQIWYGVHRSTEAVMTCLVSSTEDTGHIHFIDGASGGYAVAAQQLKLQKKGAN